MVDLGLYNYVKNAVAQGKSKETVEAELVKGGWTPELIQEAWISVSTNQAAPSAVPTAPGIQTYTSPSISTGAIQATNTRPQKSTFWIWTTLWLTALFTAFLIEIVFTLLVVASANFIPLGLNILVTIASSIVFPFIAIIYGSYSATKYVFKRSVVRKDAAGKLAFLAIVVPLVGTVALFSFALIHFGVASYSPARLASLIGTFLITLTSMYGVIRYQLEKRGD